MGLSPNDESLLENVKLGKTGAVRTLIKNKANVNCKSASGNAPLHCATRASQRTVFSLLIENKADINAVDGQRNSVLHVAVSLGFHDIVLLALKAGALTNVLNEKDETPLEVTKNAETCRLVLEYYADDPFGLSKDNGEQRSKPRTSPFRELPPGPASFLFWTAMGVGKDSCMFQNFGVYPFDRLNDTERIIVLTEVAEAMSGFKFNIPCNVLNESALYAVFALMKARIKKELEEYKGNIDNEASSFLWRKRVLDAYEQVYGTDGSIAGLSVECWKRNVWNTVVNLLARSLFGESFWKKKNIFLSPTALERLNSTHDFDVAPDYFSGRLPSTASIEIQLTFKKLITMSKNFLSDEQTQPSSCFCQDCIAELEVPLAFKLQFLEEAAEDKRKIKKNKKSKKEETVPDDFQNRQMLKKAIEQRKELTLFWLSLSIEEKWRLTEMTTSELSDLVSASVHWESLRAAQDSYKQFALEDEILEITEDCVTLTNDMCDKKSVLEVLQAMLNAAVVDISSLVPQDESSEDLWEKSGRQLLENLVLAEFIRRITARYMLRKQESLAQQVALELELELLEEEKQSAPKKTKNKKKRGKKASTESKAKQPEEGRNSNLESETAPSASISSGTKKIDASTSKTENSDGQLQAERTKKKSKVNRDVSEQGDLKSSVRQGGATKLQSKTKGASESSGPFEKNDVDNDGNGSEEETESEFSTNYNNPFATLLDDGEAAVKSNGIKKKSQAAKLNGEHLREKEKIKAKHTQEEVSKLVHKKSRGISKDVSQVDLATRGAKESSVPKDHVERPLDSNLWWEKYTDGMIFISSKQTHDECIRLGLMGLPRPHLKVVRSLKKQRSALFLFHVDERKLYGVFEAVTDGGENLNPHAWSKSKHPRSSPYPAQIKFKLQRGYAPIEESAFSNIFGGGNKIRKLDKAQVQQVIGIFRSRESSAAASNKKTFGSVESSQQHSQVSRKQANSMQSQNLKQHKQSQQSHNQHLHYQKAQAQTLTSKKKQHEAQQLLQHQRRRQQPHLRQQYLNMQQQQQKPQQQHQQKQQQKQQQHKQQQQLLRRRQAQPQQHPHPVQHLKSPLKHQQHPKDLQSTVQAPSPLMHSSPFAPRAASSNNLGPPFQPAQSASFGISNSDWKNGSQAQKGGRGSVSGNTNSRINASLSTNSALFGREQVQGVNKSPSIHSQWNKSKQIYPMPSGLGELRSNTFVNSETSPIVPRQSSVRSESEDRISHGIRHGWNEMSLPVTNSSSNLAGNAPPSLDSNVVNPSSSVQSFAHSWAPGMGTIGGKNSIGGLGGSLFGSLGGNSIWGGSSSSGWGSASQESNNRANGPSNK